MFRASVTRLSEVSPLRTQIFIKNYPKLTKLITFKTFHFKTHNVLISKAPLSIKSVNLRRFFSKQSCHTVKMSPFVPPQKSSSEEAADTNLKLAPIFFPPKFKTFEERQIFFPPKLESFWGAEREASGIT
jgi:hypothetical protein